MRTRTIKVGETYGLRGRRSNVNGRLALPVTVTEIIGAHGGRVSTHRFDRFIARSGTTEFYGVSRHDLMPIKT